MTIDYSVKGKVQIKMLDYVDKLLAEAPDCFGGEWATPAGEHLFQVNPDCTPLDKDRSELFHHLVGSPAKKFEDLLLWS